MEAPKEELPVLFVVYGNSKDRSPYLRAMSFWSFPFLFGVNGSSKDRSPYLRAMMEAPKEELPFFPCIWQQQKQRFFSAGNDGSSFLFLEYGSSKDRSPYLRAMMEAPNEGLPVLSGVYGSSKDRSPYLRAMMGAPNEKLLFSFRCIW